MQPKQLIGGAIAIGLPLVAVWMMMQPPGGGVPAAAPAAETPAAPAAAQPAAAPAAKAPVKVEPSAILSAPVPVPKAHAKAASSPVAAAAGAKGQEYALFFTANDLGELDDCGCNARPLGGLARRSKWIADRVKEKRFKAWISVSSGGVLSLDPELNVPPLAELKSLAKTVFSAYKKMNYVAMNVGTHDLAMGADELKKAAAAQRFPVISANIVGADGKPAFTEHVVTSVGRIKVGVFGLLAAAPPGKKQWVDDKGLKITAPIAAAKAQVEALRAKGCQLIIAAAQLSDEEKDELGQKVPGVDLVLGSLKQDLTHQRPESLGRGFFADPYHKGKWVGEFIIRPGAKQDRWYVVGLRDKLQTEQVSLERQVSYYVKQFKEEDAARAKGEPVKSTERERKFAEERFAGVRAKLARVKLELKDDLDVAAGGSTLQMKMYPMRAEELKEDPAVLTLVQAHQKVYPPPAKNH